MEIADFFKDRNGKIVIVQFPNWPLWSAIIFWILGKIPLGLETMSRWGVTASLIYWSYLEIVSGVNGFRKILGVTVFIIEILTIIKYLGLLH